MEQLDRKPQGEPVQIAIPRIQIPRISATGLFFFRGLVRRYFRRHFHAVRVSCAEHLRQQTGPLIVYANHSSWWDPMVCFLLSAELLPGRPHFAPMDAAALQRYSVLGRLGIFPVQIESARGAVQFLRTGEAIVRSGGVLWVTPQGRFADNRERPLVFKPGLAALAARLGTCTVLPLAIEYTFWDERKPETLLHFGQPVHVAGERADVIEARLLDALAIAMDQLRAKALARDSRGFDITLARGVVGAGGMYAFGKRLRALATRQSYRAEHSRSPDSPGGTPDGTPELRS